MACYIVCVYSIIFNESVLPNGIRESVNFHICVYMWVLAEMLMEPIHKSLLLFQHSQFSIYMYLGFVNKTIDNIYQV